MPKLRIEEAAARRQAAHRLRGEEVIVGVNKYRLKEEAPIDILDVDNTAVREAQIARLEKMRASRDEAACQRRPCRHHRGGQNEEQNLLGLCVDAARARASVGEISDAMEKVFGRHKAVIKLDLGVYGAVVESDEDFSELQQRIAAFAAARRAAARASWSPRWARTATTAAPRSSPPPIADIGFDVDIGPLFQTPEEAANQAVENDVHVVGISSLAAGHKTLLPQLIAELRQLGREDIMVVCGGVIPRQDYDSLHQAGAARHLRPRHPDRDLRHPDAGCHRGKAAVTIFILIVPSC